MSKFNRMSTEKANQAMQEALDAINTGSKRVSLKDGMNVFYIVPAVGATTYPLQFMHVHYRPFHVCLRPLAYDAAAGKTVPVKKFEICPRCIGAWNERTKHIGQDDKDPKKFSSAQELAQKKFKADMPSERVVAQVVDLTPFFSMVDGEPEPNHAVLQASFEDFLNVMSGGAPAEKMSEDLLAAAEAGPCPLPLNVDIGKRVDSIYRRAMKESKSDPTFMPEEFLVFIKKTKDKFEGGIQKYVYDVARVSEKFLKNGGWAAIMEQYGERFMEVIGDRAIDMLAPDKSGDLAQDAANLVKLQKPDMLAYLEQAGHSFAVKFDQPDSDGEEQAPSQSYGDSASGEELEVAPIKAQDLSASRAAFQRKRKEKLEDAD